MKKILVLLGIVWLVTSCSMDEDNLRFQVEFLPAISVETPEYMQAGHTYEFKVKYNRPTDCYYFDGFYHEPDGNAHIIAVQALVIQNSDCQPLDTLVPEEAIFQIACSPDYTASTYQFKFYQGEDDEGNQRFIEVEVPVEQ